MCYLKYDFSRKELIQGLDSAGHLASGNLSWNKDGGITINGASR